MRFFPAHEAPEAAVKGCCRGCREGEERVRGHDDFTVPLVIGDHVSRPPPAARPEATAGSCPDRKSRKLAMCCV